HPVAGTIGRTVLAAVLPPRNKRRRIMMMLLSLAAGIAVALLGWNLVRRFSADRIEALMEKRRGTSRLVSRADPVDGDRHLGGALAETQSTLFYENAAMKPSIDLHWIREIE